MCDFLIRLGIGTAIMSIIGLVAAAIVTYGGINALIGITTVGFFLVIAYALGSLVVVILND